LHYFTKFDKEADYVAVVEDRPIKFGAEYPLPVIFWPKLTHTTVARASLAKLLVCIVYYDVLPS